MVVDNRYFPWFPYVYNGSDHRHGCLRVDPFFITASSAWNIQGGMKQKEYGYPILQGPIDYQSIAASLEKLGYANPIPAQWQYAYPFGLDAPSTFEGQGLSFTGYVPLTQYLGVGASLFVMRLATQTSLLPNNELAAKLSLQAPGNQFNFNALTEQIESLVGTCDGYRIETGPSDIDVYLRAYHVMDYMYWCRKIDVSADLGVLIPTGVQASMNYIGSVPFGGNGFWGFYVSPAVEVELREDWKLGFDLRIQKRFSQIREQRIPCDKENSLFAPEIGTVWVNPGITVLLCPYAALEHMRDGLGIMAKYTYVFHQKDYLEDRRANPFPNSNFREMVKNSTWTQEYITLELFYDVSYKHSWTYRPMCTLSWDIPLNVLGARGSSKTTRVAVGLMVDF
jgi:hypothetical protein